MPQKKQKPIHYEISESFEKLTKLQEMAISQENVSLALKAEELKGKLAGLYNEKKETSDFDSTPFEIRIIKQEKNNDYIN